MATRACSSPVTSRRARRLPALPLMEDVDLVRRIGRHGLVRARRGCGDLGGRCDRDGWLTRPLRNLGASVVFRRLVANRHPAPVQMKRHLVIFARAPQFGRVKRRLAAAIGPAAAMRFYRQTLDRQIRTLSRDRRWTVWLFITPDHALDHPAWHRANVRGQGQGDLGQRMKQPFRLLPPGPLVLVGSDIPAIRPRHITRAFALLGRHDLVFGPATDGGSGWSVRDAAGPCRARCSPRCDGRRGRAGRHAGHDSGRICNGHRRHARRRRRCRSSV